MEGQISFLSLKAVKRNEQQILHSLDSQELEIFEECPYEDFDHLSQVCLLLFRIYSSEIERVEEKWQRSCSRSEDQDIRTWQAG